MDTRLPRCFGWTWLLTVAPPLLLQGAETPVRKLQGHTSSVMAVAFSPDGEILASGCRDRTVKLWRVRNGSLHRTLEGHTADVYSVAFSPDGKTLATAGGDRTVRLWDPQTGALR